LKCRIAKDNKNHTAPHGIRRVTENSKGELSDHKSGQRKKHEVKSLEKVVEKCYIEFDPNAKRRATMKKLTARIMLFVMTTALAIACAACGQTPPPPPADSWRASEGLELELYTQGEETFASVTGSGTCTDEVIYLPKKHEGATVTLVNTKAFTGATSATKIVFSDTIKQVVSNESKDEWPFANCTAEVDMSLCAEMTYIPQYAFKNYKGAKVTLPEGLKYIHRGVFQYSAITEITFPKSLIGLDNNVFENCTQLLRVNFAEDGSLTTLSTNDGGGAIFSGCTALTEIVIPATVKSLGRALFANCTADVRWEAPITAIIGADPYCGIFDTYKRETYVIPTTVEEIGPYTFHNCASTNVIVPVSVKKLGANAFTYHTSAWSDNKPVDRILYAGTRAQWDAIEKEGTTYNDAKTTLYCYSENPSDVGHYWRYDSDGELEFIEVKAEDLIA